MNTVLETRVTIGNLWPVGVIDAYVIVVIEVYVYSIVCLICM